MAQDYRCDINGMRALAVLGVVAYHFDLGVFPGGFSGVDVFFVISGFLMTRIIMSRLEAERFSFLGFYEARARRILPAFVVMVLGVMLVGIAVLNPLRLSALAQGSSASLLFFSNFLYLGRGGYFAMAANQNWLLHTWSLAVEWQFYIVYPFLLVALRRVGLRRRGTGLVFAAFLALSLAATLAARSLGSGHLDASFYLLPGRSWEFLAGGLCALAPVVKLSSYRRAALHYAGLLMVLTGMIAFGRSTTWPSAATLVPVVGTAMLLLADRQVEFWSKAAAVRKTGLWSYSIYLWHWPIAAFLSSHGLWSLPVRGLGVAVSVVAGATSFRFIERPFIDRAALVTPSPRRRLALVGTPAFAAVLLISLTAQATDGFEPLYYLRQPHLRAMLADYRAAAEDWRFPASCGAFATSATGLSTCTFGDPAARDVLVIGDSFAQQIAPRYAGRTFGPHAGMTFITHAGCPMLPGVDRPQTGSNCVRWREEAYAYAERSSFKRVVFFASWLAYTREGMCLTEMPDCGSRLDDSAFDAALQLGFRRMGQRWKALKDSGKEIVAVDIMPFGSGEQDGNPVALYQRAIDGRPSEAVQILQADFEHDKEESTARLAAAARMADATLVDPAESLCSRGVCPIVEGGRTLFKDTYHLRASAVVEPRFAFLDEHLLFAQPPIAAQSHRPIAAAHTARKVLSQLKH